MNLENHLNEVTQKYLQSGKPLSQKDESYLQEKMYQTSYKLYNINKTKFAKMEKMGFSFQV